MAIQSSSAKTGVSSFLGIIHTQGKTYSFTLILSQLSITPDGKLSRPPLAIFWFLHGVLGFLGGFNSPRTGVSDSLSVFSFSWYFDPPPRSPCSMVGFKIPLVHCLVELPRTHTLNILLVSSTPSTTGCRLRHKILEMTSSL
jgi:hypothetical protein